ncbi:MAG: macrocin O-methyltransferase, partial [Proteobacteria bacterium]|nr:macrocin O-methyltransferase [Pseudomonadota bacterium]
GYPFDRFNLSAGDILQTMPKAAPGKIALLRLDTDWYESSRHELDHLYPRLESGGVLIIDDYGDWDGARLAVDEYFAQASVFPLLCRIDGTGRIAVKV